MPAKARGLGRGLDALLPKGEEGGAKQVPLERLTPSPYQPRARLDEAAVAELAASVAAQGVLQPLLVRPTEDGYEIVAGERRFRAATRAGLSTVPVVVRDLDDRTTLEVAITENLQREDLSPLEEAQAYERLQGFGMDQAAVAEAVGKSRSAVANALRLLSLPAAAREALDAGRISAGHARAILAQPEAHRGWALEQILRRGLNVRQAEALRAPSEATPRSASDGRYAALEDDLARQLGTKVRVQGGRKGRIELHFRSREELERLLERLGYQA
ncbi:MAG: ParB/RepB/Spo0J family partition protein [Trueperaceae bacterium]|nr:ParB/RepB/Spo0J family partition protein [Trueperaceae bacterium]